MQDYSNRSYQDFFKEELYGRFVRFLLDKYDARTVITILGSDSLMSKKGVHPSYRRDFNVFLALNPAIEKVFSHNHHRFMSLRNIGGGPLAFPIDPDDDGLMVKENIRVSNLPPADLSAIARASKKMKKVAAPMRGQKLKGDWNERKYLLPKRLTVHFKEGYATKLGKTTMSFMVESRSEAIHIIFDRYEKRVAYAAILGEEEFCMVKPRNGKIKRNRKLRG